jgi:hypothetical protein
MYWLPIFVTKGPSPDPHHSKEMNHQCEIQKLKMRSWKNPSRDLGAYKWDGIRASPDHLIYIKMFSWRNCTSIDSWNTDLLEGFLSQEVVHV